MIHLINYFFESWRQTTIEGLVVNSYSEADDDKNDDSDDDDDKNYDSDDDDDEDSCMEQSSHIRAIPSLMGSMHTTS